MTNTIDGLRRWAKGIYPLEAGVELLGGAFGGRFTGSGYPWIQPLGDSYYLAADQITEDAIGAYSGGEQRVLRITAALLGGAPVNLHEALPGLDREHAELVGAAVAHAAGRHQQGDTTKAPAEIVAQVVGDTRAVASRLPFDARAALVRDLIKAVRDAVKFDPHTLALHGTTAEVERLSAIGTLAEDYADDAARAAMGLRSGHGADPRP